MFFFTINNANINFAKKELIQRFHTTKDTLSINYRLEFINKKKFIKIALN